MAAIKLTGFGGMMPAQDETLLPPNAAAHSENAWVYSGKLVGMRQPIAIKSVTAGTAKVARIPNTLNDSTHIADSTFLEFTDQDTDIIRAPVVNDTYDRYYWTSSSDVPMYNTAARIKNGDLPWKLGIPSNAASSITVVGGTGSDVTRSYVTTWVTEYGEEGPASTPVVKTGKTDGSWDLTIPAVAATDDGSVGDDRNITKVRIYRTVTSVSGVTTFFFVAEQLVSDTTYSDTATDDVVSANNILESTNWVAPPNLRGFVSMPNGIIAGFTDKDIYFCEPYRPHAWPAAYTIAVDSKIIGLGVVGQTLVVCTETYPWGVTGIHPSVMAQTKSQTFEPCLSRGSILSTAEGVYYASPNGLVFVGAGVVRNITPKLLSKEKWQNLVAVSSLRAAQLGTGYFAFGSAQSLVFEPTAFETTAFQQEDNSAAYTGLLMEVHDQRVAYTILSRRQPVISVQNDPWSGDVLFIEGTTLYHFNMGEGDPTPQVYKWRSRKYELNKIHNLGAMRIQWKSPTNVPTPDANSKPSNTLGGAEFPWLANGVIGYARVYADGTLVWERQLMTSGEIMKLASGFKAEFWQFEIETYAEVTSIQVATSTKELKSA